MCEFCHTHGEGGKWYLQARNYAEDLLSDLNRRAMIADFFREPKRLARADKHLAYLDRVPRPLRGLIAGVVVRRQKRRHYGQVIPLEDVNRVFDLATSVVRLACICRMTTAGPEQRYCYGISLGAGGGELAGLIGSIGADYLTGPDAAGLEVVDKQEALASFHSYERQGLCHTVWTFETPFIAGICNCNRTDCYAMRATVGHGVPVFFRAEYAMEVRPERCTGCLACTRVCQFGAAKSGAGGRAAIDSSACYGCGICRAVCPAGALVLVERAGSSASSATHARGRPGATQRG